MANPAQEQPVALPRTYARGKGAAPARTRGRPTRVSELVRPLSLRHAFRRLFVLLLVLGALHVAAMMLFEGLDPFQALWLTMTTMTTVGYGDLSPETLPGRMSTMLLVFLGGIWIAFQAAATYFESRTDRRDRMRLGLWRWNMTGHILVLNVPSQQATAYLIRLVKEFRASRRFRDTPVQLLCTCFPNGLPSSLSALGVVHHQGEIWDPDALREAGAPDAGVVVVLADSDVDPASDASTLDAVDRLRDIGCTCRILAECVMDENRPRFRRFGADVIVRPLRGYPEMIVRALAAPGSEAILEDLFTSSRDECWRYDVDVNGWLWEDLVSLLVRRDIGVPIAFRNTGDERIIINPHTGTTIHADKLYVLVREGNARPDSEIAALLGS